MPEGHTVHRHARELARRFRGAPVRVSSPQGRFGDGARALDGREVVGTDAHGKHLFLDVAHEADEPARTLHVHLGLYGKWTFGTGEPPAPRGLVRARLENGEHWADLRGPTACEVLEPEQVSAVHERLGPDPLRGDDPGPALARIGRSRAPVAGLLMQQEVVAGVGVVYRAEALFRAGLDPYRPGRAVGEETLGELWSDLRELLRTGVRAGRIVTTRPEHRSRPTGRVTRADAHYVYRRTGEPCRVCSTPVAHADLAGRHLYWCPRCQPG
ncbi:Fpg/Nei family DNA glycosylase [Kineococcus gynurae]|uniref:DNA-(apurinic or apyrimidinic site) lyase n=1 Tax=Kineococcus gynurae TaxID=452979 RepID=A0ABV5LW34_9ACTN